MFRCFWRGVSLVRHVTTAVLLSLAFVACFEVAFRVPLPGEHNLIATLQQKLQPSGRSPAR
jgi:hypothetical protein